MEHYILQVVKDFEGHALLYSLCTIEERLVMDLEPLLATFSDSSLLSDATMT